MAEESRLRICLTFSIFLTVVVQVSSARADFHLTIIDEVMAGLNGNARVQFVELTMLSDDQNCQGTGNHPFGNEPHDASDPPCDTVGPGAKLIFLNAAGTQTGEFVFPQNSRIGFERSILVGTQEFAALPNAPQPDFIMSPDVVPGSGTVCYVNVPSAPFVVGVCLRYGGSTGLPELPITGNLSLKRRQCCFESDFVLSTPAPRNNAGVCGSTLDANHCPVADAQHVTTPEETPINIRLTGSDPEGAPVTFSLFGSPRRGIVLGAPPDVVYIPLSNLSGPDSFSFKVHDGTFSSEPATVSIDVTPVNDSPLAISQNVMTGQNIPVNIKLSGRDPDLDTLSFSVVTFPTNGSLSGTLPDVIYTPDSGFLGSDSFSFRVSDREFSSDPATVSIAVRLLLKVTKAGTGFGTVTGPFFSCSTACTQVTNGFDLGASVVLNALPALGSTFTGWSGGGCTGVGACTVTMNSNLEITATFAVNDCSVTPIVFGETKTGTLGSTDCAARHNPSNVGDLYTFTGRAGQNVTIIMNPISLRRPFAALLDPFGAVIAASSFSDSSPVFIPDNALSGGAVVLPSDGTYLIEVTTTSSGLTGDYTVRLSEAQQFTLSVSKTGTGTGTVTSSPSGINCGADCSEPYIGGRIVTLTASPSNGSLFAGWSGGGCAGTGSCMLTVNGNVAVTATFTPPTFIATAAPQGGETWRVGSTQTIRWTSNGISGSINIQLSRDGGATWKTIVKNTTNDGTQSWKVTKGSTTRARIRVCAVSVPSICGMTSNNFTIQ